MCGCQCVRVLGRLPDGPDAECQGAGFCGACGSGTEGGGVSSVAQRLVWLLTRSRPALGGLRNFPICVAVAASAPENEPARGRGARIAVSALRRGDTR